MAFITLDKETYYDNNQTLKKLTYELYMRSELFRVQGFAFKWNDKQTEWVPRDRTEEALRDLFPAGNDHTLICQNAMFDASILSWYYGLRAETYYCTQRMSKALWNQAPADLASLVKRLFPNDETMRKGDELEQSKGVWDWTDEINHNVGEVYGVQDVDLTFAAFKAMYPYFPTEEFKVLDKTLKMFIHPAFILDRERVVVHLANIQEEKAAFIDASGTTREVLASGQKFVDFCASEHDVIIEKIPSPTIKNPSNMKYPLAKDALEFLALRKERHDLTHLWNARLSVTSTIEETRSKRMLDHALVSHINPEGWIAMALNYCAAHTTRWGGTNKVNPQNFKRGSELRRSLKAPDGYDVNVADAANIEGRFLAWFAGQEDKLQAFKDDIDIYNLLATMIYGRPIFRKLEVMGKDGKLYIPDYIEGFVGKVAELGLGYNMGWMTFQNTLAKGALGGPQLFFPDQQCKDIVKLYRTTNYKIVDLWKMASRWIFDMACPHMEPYEYKCIRIEQGRIRLPNGLYLNYPQLRQIDHPDAHLEFEYWNGKFFTKIYGGKLVENIIQALARICIAVHLVEIDDFLATLNDKSRVALTVHDEIVAINKTINSEKVYNRMIEIMRVCPSWCDDGSLVLDAEGGYAPEYSK